MELRSFCFDHDELFVVPVEHLRPDGVDPEFARIANGERGISGDVFDLLGEAVATYFERVQSLFERGRPQWFPPRLMNLCIVTDPQRARLYYQPLVGASLLLFASDFDPERSNRELATYHLVHAERLGITRSLTKTVLGNLGYFIVRSHAERSHFAEAARLAHRPDAESFAALGEAMEWMGGVLHEQLHPPLLRTDGLTSIPGTGLLVTDEQTLKIGELVEVFEQVGTRALDRYYATQAASLGGASPEDRVAGHLLERRPQLLVADRQGRVIWDPDNAEDVTALAGAVHGMCDRAALAVCRDLELVAERTGQVLSRISNPDALPSHGDEVQQRDGAYLHEDRKMMVYSLHQPGVDTNAEGTPPFHRWLLGARVGHEWGHLVAEAGLVRVPPHEQRRHDEALGELAVLFDTVIAGAPQVLREQVDAQFSGRPRGQTIGHAMVTMQMQRIGDYASNVFAHAVLPVEEMEAYVRVNVRTLAAEPFSFLGKLARYAYEYQYLRFSRMEEPRDYFFATTWFSENYIATGVVSRADADRMLDLMAEACGRHQLVPHALTPAS